ncbi:MULTISPECIES: hypothetical protein [unclassified Streptomyces]|uniref:hypothetical protein n=1 Tax=unclassified Streptomyces TaxID=2593676 RepID=UPI00342C3A90
MKMKRALVAMAMTLGAVGVPLATATSAQATQSQCTNYLASKGYIVGGGVRSACSHGTFLGGAHPLCTAKLLELGITNGTHINEACKRA